MVEINPGKPLLDALLAHVMIFQDIPRPEGLFGGEIVQKHVDYLLGQGLVKEEGGKILIAEKKHRVLDFLPWVGHTTAFLSRSALNMPPEAIRMMINTAMNAEEVRSAFDKIPERFRGIILSAEYRRKVLFTRGEAEEIARVCPPPFLFFLRCRGHFRVVVPLEVENVFAGHTLRYHEGFPLFSFALSGIHQDGPSQLAPVDLLVSRLISDGLRCHRHTGRILISEIRSLIDVADYSKEVLEKAGKFVSAHLAEKNNNCLYIPQDTFLLVTDDRGWERALAEYLQRVYPEVSWFFFLLPKDGAFHLPAAGTVTGAPERVKEAVDWLEEMGAGTRQSSDVFVLYARRSYQHTRVYAQSNGEIHVTGPPDRVRVFALSAFARLARAGQYHTVLVLRRDVVLRNAWRFGTSEQALKVFRKETGDTVLLHRLKNLLKY